MIQTATGRTQTNKQTHTHTGTYKVSVSQSCIINLSFEVQWSLRTTRISIQNFCLQSVFGSQCRQYVRYSWLLDVRCVDFAVIARMSEGTNHRQPCILPFFIIVRSANKNIFFNTALVHFFPRRTYCIYTHVNIIYTVHQFR